MNNDEIMNATIINYDDVDRKLLKLRENSLTYLKDAIDWNQKDANIK